MEENKEQADKVSVDSSVENDQIKNDQPLIPITMTQVKTEH